MQTRNTLTLVVIFAVSLISGCSCPVEEKETRNKEVIERIYAEGVNKQDPGAWDEVLSDDYTRYCQAMPSDRQQIHGIEGMKKFLREQFIAFPDWHERVSLLVAEGDFVSYVTSSSGTHKGPLGGIPATGKTVTDAMTFVVHRFIDGKIVESWVIWDNVYFMSQLGIMPPITGTEGGTPEE